jgi:hypothetical protein
MWPLMHPATAPPAAQRFAPPPITEVSFGSPQQAGYQKAKADIEQLLHKRLSLLRPESRAQVEMNLRIVRDANEGIRRDLEADPASPLLLRFLQNTDQQEFDLHSPYCLQFRCRPVYMRRRAP